MEATSVLIVDDEKNIRHTLVDQAAATLGIDASTLWRKRKRYDEGA